MSKKNGLGKDVVKSMEIMDQLSECLRNFTSMPLKRGLKSNKIEDEKLVKVIDEASEKAMSLKNSIENIENQVKSAKPIANSRFASRVVKRFLEENIY